MVPYPTQWMSHVLESKVCDLCRCWCTQPAGWVDTTAAVQQCLCHHKVWASAMLWGAKKTSWLSQRWTARVFSNFDVKPVKATGSTLIKCSCEYGFWRMQVFIAPFFQHSSQQPFRSCSLTSCGLKDMRLEVTQLLLENHQCVGCTLLNIRMI